MRILLAVLLLAVPVLGQMFSDLNEQWEAWKMEHHKIYQDQDEMAYRRTVWEKNLKLIVKHNQEASAGLHTFTMGLNHLADMTTEEVNTQLNGVMMEDDNDDQHIHFDNVTFKEAEQLPSRVDWRKKGRVSRVRNQKKCGSCWAFAAVGALEGQTKRKTGKLIPLSPQNLVDCSKENLGCKGGWPYKAFKYVRRNGGIDSDTFYSYKNKAEKCRYSKKGKAASCKGYRFVKRGSERALKTAVAKVGPVAVSINARLKSFQLYKEGVYNVRACRSKYRNHAVLVVGYGKYKGQNYWLVKNSWGTKWGIKGYVRMARNKKNQCGIASRAVYPLV